MVAFGGAITPGVQIAGVMLVAAAVYFERTDADRLREDRDDIAKKEDER